MRKLFRRNPSPVKKEDNKPSLPILKKMATTKELKKVLKKIEHEKIPTVRNAWIDYFLEKTKRPKYEKD